VLVLNHPGDLQRCVAEFKVFKLAELKVASGGRRWQAMAGVSGEAFNETTPMLLVAAGVLAATEGRLTPYVAPLCPHIVADPPMYFRINPFNVRDRVASPIRVACDVISAVAQRNGRVKG
jgi:hypothetical protein